MVWLEQFFNTLNAPIWMVIGAFITALLTGSLTGPALRLCGGEPGHWKFGMTMIAAAMGAGLAWAMHVGHCQEVPEVRPSVMTHSLRILFHLIFLACLLVVTATDLATLYIPDFVLLLGGGIAITAAFLVGDLQIAHVWVDWNAEIPQIQGPDIPMWLAEHPHLHGLAWSLVGAGVGAGLTQLVKSVAEKVLGQPAMGSGDVTLMAMVGAFLGWQPTVVAFFFAPLLALALGPLARRISRERAVPYGPFLAAGAILVLFAWRWIWMFEIDISLNAQPGEDDRLTRFAIRRLFGDGLLLMGLLIAALGGTALLMGVLRWFRSMEVRSPR